MRFKFVSALLLSIAFITSCHTDIGLDQADSDSDKAVIHDDPSDYVWDNSQVTAIVLKGSSASITGAGASSSGSTVNITSPGTYKISGSFTNGQVLVNESGSGVVRLLLDGASVTCSNNAPVYIMAADKVVINLVANTTSTLTDGSAYNTTDEPNAALYSKSDLTIFGEGCPDRQRQLQRRHHQQRRVDHRQWYDNCQCKGRRDQGQGFSPDQERQVRGDIRRRRIKIG